MMRVPFVDLKGQYDTIRGDIDGAIRSVIDESAFIGGRFVGRFEEEFARALGVRHCVGVGNGTDAIFIALKALGVGRGDEVVTVANSWISTSEAVTLTGAAPVFVDIDADSFTIDVNRIEEKISPRTRAILPVHLYGQAADLGALRRLCDAHGLFLVEDCAQAHLAEFEGRKVGTFGDAATFSFFPGKNLGAYGDAGAVVTGDAEVARRVRMFANHGGLKKHEHEMEGTNSRLDGMQAAVLSVKLGHLERWNGMRRRNALIYADLLAGLDEVKLPHVDARCGHVFHLFVVVARQRDLLRSHLEERGIATGIHYPTPLPLLRAYAHMGHVPGDFPVAHRLSGGILSLPMYPEMTEEQAGYVAEAVRGFYKG